LRSALLNTAPMSPTQGCASIACVLATPRGDNPQSGTGTAGSIITSGWVMR